MNKAKILIDLTKVKNPYCGLGQFSINLGKELIRQNPNQFELSFLLHNKSSYWFKDKVRIETPSFLSYIFRNRFRKYSFWHAIHQDSRFHSLLKKLPYILTIHDLNFLEEKSPEKIKRRLNSLQKKINGAIAITSISEYSKQEIIRNFNIPDIPFEVIYNGVEDLSEKKDERPAVIPNGDFLFTIGVITEKKNFHVLIDFIDKIPNLNLIIAGDDSGKYANEIKELAKSKNLQSRVFLPGKISEAEKLWYYRNCKAFVFPSLLEGFGLPVIEAMQSGKAVFLSNKCSLPEIAKDKAYYWNNFEPDYMADVYATKMNEYYNDNERTMLIKKHAAGFSMSKSIEAYIALYGKLLIKQ